MKKTKLYAIPGAPLGLLKMYGLFLSTVLSLALALPCYAQELEPRRWSHLPIDTNFAGGAYAYTKADIAFDPVLLIEDAEMELQTSAVKYIRTFALFEKPARIEFAQGYQKGRWTGLVDGVHSSVNRNGLSDSFMRFAINIFGAPPLKGKEYAAYRANLDVETIVGTALAVQLPTGDYMDDKLINLGTNRYTFRPQLGVLHTRGKWSLEVTTSAWIYSDNDDFWGGNKLEQDPLYTVQTHLVRTFHRGIWAGAGVGYGYGGESTVNGVEKNDRKGNLVGGLSFSFPIRRQLGVKIGYIGTRTQESTGLDSDTVALSFSTFW